MFVYFSSLLDEPVMDKNRELLGKLCELIATPADVYPKVVTMVISRGVFKKKYALVPWDRVAESDRKGVHLKCEKASLNFGNTIDYQDKIALRRDILDQQVIDTYNYNVIRVNDIHLLKVERDLMVAHVDIGARGLLRRLGLENITVAFIGIFFRKKGYLKSERLIAWKYVQPLSINPVSKAIKINIPQKDLRSIPAADLGDIMMDLDPKQKINLFTSLDSNTQIKIFGHLDFSTQRDIAEEIGPVACAGIIKEMPDDEATDFLERMPRRSTDIILDNMATKEAKKLSRLIGYASDSAGGLMTTDYIAIRADTDAEKALNIIREKEFLVEPIQYVYIVDEEKRLVGITNLRRLIGAPPAEAIASIAFPNTIYVHLDAGVKEVAYIMEKYKCQVVPVVNSEHMLQGIIAIDDILSQVIAIAWRKTRKKVPRTL